MARAKWVDQFCIQAKSNGLDCIIENRVNGWPETVNIGCRKCFTKSVTYNFKQGLYFLGVDPKKIEEKGDVVIICGGTNGFLRDIFIIPWSKFFDTLKRAESINTYRQPKEYRQYKLSIKNNANNWLMVAQGGERPVLNITQWRYNAEEAISFLR